jgi:hypothetical protein
MIILNEKSSNPSQPLKEMAQFKGAGITVEVRSNDHGVLGSPGNPAHAHVLGGNYSDQKPSNKSFGGLLLSNR